MPLLIRNRLNEEKQKGEKQKGEKRKGDRQHDFVAPTARKVCIAKQSNPEHAALMFVNCSHPVPHASALHPVPAPAPLAAFEDR